MKKIVVILILLLLTLGLLGCTQQPPAGQETSVTCSEQNGFICKNGEKCEGAILTAKDSTTCCLINCTKLCGNNIVDSGETCSSCPNDVNCASNQLCCSGLCTTPACNSAADCNDNDNSTLDNCMNAGACGATCAHNKITTCTDGDKVCPTSCNVFNDNDCNALALGTTADSGNLKLTVSNSHIEICTSEYSEDRDTYLVFDISVENKGTEEEYISSTEFIAIDPNRKQFDGSIVSYPWAFGGNCENAENTAFKGGNLLPGSKDNGKIWIELSSTGDYAKGKWYIVHKKTFSLEDVYTIYETQIGNPATNTPITCISGKTLQNNVCVPCGAEGQPACSSSGCNFGYEGVNGICTEKCLEGFEIRQNGVCVGCGTTGDPCCANNKCLSISVCQNNVCVSCGSVDESCCENNECFFGTCTAGVCKSPF